MTKKTPLTNKVVKYVASNLLKPKCKEPDRQTPAIKI